MKTSFRGKLRKFFHSNRIVAIIALLILQLAWIAYYVFALTRAHYWLTFVTFTVKAVFILVIIGTTRNPAYKIGWIILVSMFSVFGCVLYLIYGFNFSNKKIRSKIEKSVLNNGKRETDLAVKREVKKLGKTETALCKYLDNKGFPVFSDSRAEYYSCGEKFFPDFIDELKKAEKFIFIETFIIDYGEIWTEILDVLKERAEKGVKIKILYDDMGTISRLPSFFHKKISALHENIECEVFNKVKIFLVKSINNRDHRKIAVVDGKVAFTGGMNVADEYANISSPFGYWKDSMVKIEGLAVDGFTRIFLDLWNACAKTAVDLEEHLVATAVEGEGFIQPFSANPFNKTDIAFHVYLDMINKASDYIYISSPYLVPDSELISSLIHASQRGVEVKILIPFIPDKKIVYRLTKANLYSLMQNGVKIYFYKPGFNHAKTVVIDGRIAVVGTVNMDYMSLFLNFECGALLYGGKVVKEVATDLENAFADSVLVEERHVKTSVVGKFIDTVLKTIEMLF